MARPLYCLCAAGVSTDSESGLVSVFELLEGIRYGPLPRADRPGAAVFVRYKPLRALSCWLMEPEKGDSYDDEYEHEVLVEGPGGEKFRTAATPFRFDGAGQRRVHRFSINLDSPPPVTRVGTLRFVFRIRKVGDDNWLSQDYLAFVEEALPGFPDTAGGELPPTDQSL